MTAHHFEDRLTEWEFWLEEHEGRWLPPAGLVLLIMLVLAMFSIAHNEPSLLSGGTPFVSEEW